MNKQNIKNILEKEIRRHYDKEQSYRLLNKGCKGHKLKITKHLHKRHQTIKLAKSLGFGYCECCGNLK